VVSDSLIAGAKGVSCRSRESRSIESVFLVFETGDDEGVKNAGDPIADRGVGWCRMGTDVAKGSTGVDVV
jgi:hypothetical protein